MDTTKEIETIEKELEEGGDAGSILPISTDDQLFVLEKMAQNADRMIAAKQKIWAACLKITKPEDWTVFTSQGKSKAELGGAGALRYASFLGIGFGNWTSEKVTGTDEVGQWYRWDFECDAIFAGRTIRVYGRAGSRDKFFGKAQGEFKELHDINEGDIKQAGRRNAMKEGVKVLMGLHHMDPKELEAAGLKMGSAGGYAFKSDDDKKSEAIEVKSVTGAAEEVTQRMTANKKTVFSIHMTEGDKFDTWSETDAKTAKQAIMDGKFLTIEYTTNQYGNNVKTLTVVGATA